MSLSNSTEKKTSQQREDLERDKRLRQEQSRIAVASGQRTFDQNFFIPAEMARGSTFSFKG